MVLQAEKPVLIDFWAAWCKPCLMVAPILDELAEEYDGKVSFVKLDVDRLPFSDGSVDGIVCQHVIEHHNHQSFGDNPTYGTLLTFLGEVRRVLRTGGYFESICPNFAYIAKAYVSGGFRSHTDSITLMHWAMGGQRDEWDHHGVLLDFNLLRHWAEMAGFKRENVDLLHPFDWFGLHVKLVK